jgi:ubiquinone/menaquinone biosynthesis C-methylase UbiE
MTRIERLLVNRRAKGEHNIELVRRRLRQMDVRSMRDALEIGAGAGAVSAFLARAYGMRVWATDFDPGQIRIAQTRHAGEERLCFGVEDATRLSFEASRFDLVVSQNVFHHIANWQKAVSEVARVLRPGGSFVWLDLTLPGLVARVLRPLARNYGLYAYAEVEQAFADNGLETRFHERIAQGPIVHHHLVLHKS